MFTIDGNFHNNILYGVNKIVKKYPDTPLENRFQGTYPKGEQFGQVKENSDILSLRKAAQAHREVRAFIQPMLKPGLEMNHLANELENKTKKLLNNQGINKGIGFPTCISINNCVAHWSTDNINKRILKKNDILNIDFGTEVDGWIIDCAFTVCFNPEYLPLLDASKEGTYTGIKNAGVDVRLSEWGEKIREVIESYQCTIKNKTYDIKTVKNLGGHNILKGQIHGGEFLPLFKLNTNAKMKEGIYAIETFATTGKGWTTEDKDNNTLFALSDYNSNSIKLPKTRKFYQSLKRKFGTIPFSSRYIDKKNNSQVNYLSKIGAIKNYPPLYDLPNSYSAQYEHTVCIQDGKKEVISKGTDY